MEMQQELKTNFFENKEEFLQAKKNYLKAKAIQEKTLELEEEIKIKILKENEFFYSEEWKEEQGTRILKPFEDYHMNDKDFTRYLKLVHEERLKFVNIPSYELSIDYETRKIYEESKRQFLEIAFKIQPKSFKSKIEDLKKGYNFKLIEKFIEINLRLSEESF